MKNRIQESISVLSYPKEFNGIKLSFLQDEEKTTEDYNNFERIPSFLAWANICEFTIKQKLQKKTMLLIIRFQSQRTVQN